MIPVCFHKKLYHQGFVQHSCFWNLDDLTWSEPKLPCAEGGRQLISQKAPNTEKRVLEVQGVFTEFSAQGLDSKQLSFQTVSRNDLYKAFISFYSDIFKIVTINLFPLNVLLQIKPITGEVLQHSLSILCIFQYCSGNYCII